MIAAFTRLLLMASSVLAMPCWGETIAIDDSTIVAPATSFGVGVNGGSSWSEPLGANLVDNSCFEAPADGSGLSQSGWVWTISSGTVTASVDRSTFTSGSQSQKLVVTGFPAYLQQYHVSIPQAPLSMNLVVGKTYIIKAKLKASVAATVNFGWPSSALSPPITIGTTWATYSWTYTPTALTGTTVMSAVSLQMNTLATYWVDDFIAWAPSDMDPVTGLDATMVSRLQELKPKMLRWGGLGINGIPLALAILHPWPLSYGPPPIQDDIDLGTFLSLCAEVGASAFITVPPAFSDAAHAALGDLNSDVLSNWYADHGNLIDFVGGDASTPYGLIRQNQGFSRFDLQVPKIYYELGNEVWGTPDGKWDMSMSSTDTEAMMMNNYVTYCIARMTAMKARPGWRSNMRVGFGGAGPNMFIGQWGGSYDFTMVPAVKALTDFSTINLYYGTGATTDTDEYIYGGLFARHQGFARDITAMKTAFKNAAGHDIETCMYEGQSKWGPGYSSYPAAGAGYDNMIAKETSLGSGVSLLDNLCAANGCGLSCANVFDFQSQCWGIITSYPQRYRRPDFYALKMFNTYVKGSLVKATVSGSVTWNDPATGETAVPDLGCYPYLDGNGNHSIVLINRSRTTARSVTINHSLSPTTEIMLSGPDINLNNDAGEVVVPQITTLSGTLVGSYTTSIPAFSAAILVSAGPSTAIPTITPNGGTFAAATLVTLACATVGSTIHYTLDGTTPSSASPVYAGAVMVSSTTTIEAYATASSMVDSGMATATVTITAAGGSGSTAGTTTAGTTVGGATGTAGATGGTSSASSSSGSKCGLGAGLGALCGMGLLLRRFRQKAAR